MKEKKGRKTGRNAKTCERYRNAKRREYNKARKLYQHLRGKGKNDVQSPNALKKFIQYLDAEKREVLKKEGVL